MVFLFVHYVEGSFGDLYVDLFEFMEMFVFLKKDGIPEKSDLVCLKIFKPEHPCIFYLHLR